MLSCRQGGPIAYLAEVYVLIKITCHSAARYFIFEDLITIHRKHPIMAYDEKLAARVRQALATVKKVEEKKMMGGLTFMVNNKMCVGVLKDDLMFRIDPAVYEEALTKKGCREMDFTGRPMKGFVFVSSEGFKTARQLDYWIQLALAYNKNAKSSKRSPKKSKTR